jgi:hypothetical protein
MTFSTYSKSGSVSLTLTPVLILYGRPDSVELSHKTDNRYETFTDIHACDMTDCNNSGTMTFRG